MLIFIFFMQFMISCMFFMAQVTQEVGFSIWGVMFMFVMVISTLGHCKWRYQKWAKKIYS